MKTISLLYFIILLMTSCTKPQISKETLVYCSDASPLAFNPQITSDGASGNATDPLYNRLLEFKEGSTTLVPALATSWNISEDGKVYTFNLRKDVQFHTTSYFKPTRNFNSKDVLFSFRRQLKKDHPFHNINNGIYTYFNGMDMPALIEDIKSDGDHRVIITLTKSEAPFLANIAMSFMSILSAEYGEHLSKNNKKDQIDHYPIGTGPFVFKKYQKDSLIRYTSFKHYFQGESKIKKLLFAITTDPSVRFQKMKKGECDIMIDPAPADILTLKKDNQKLKLIQAPGLNIGYIAMNVRKPPLDNILVRQAINMAIDKASYIKAIYLDQAVPAKNPLPPTIWSYNDEISDYPYNISKALALLKKANLSKPIKLTLWTLPITRPYNPNGKKMGEMVQADLKKIGIEVTLVTYDWGTYLQRSRTGEHDLIQFGWTGDNGDPDNFLFTLLGCPAIDNGSNASKWCHEEFNNILMQAKSTSNIEKRSMLYKQAQVIFHEQAPWVPIAHSVIFRILHKNIQGYKISPLGNDDFYPLSWK